VTDWVALLHELADAADRIATRHFRTASLAVETKDDASPVTVADREIEAAAVALIRRRHPEMAILGEETGETAAGRDRRLIVDPIDGTRNFVRGVPIFATLLAVEEAGAVVAGLVSAPALGQRWHAARGMGAWNGARRLAVSTISRLNRAHLFHGSLGGSGTSCVPCSRARQASCRAGKRSSSQPSRASRTHWRASASLAAPIFSRSSR